MSYHPTERDIRLIRSAARIFDEEAKALFESYTYAGEWPEIDSDAEEDYKTMRTIEARLNTLAEKMQK